MPELTAATSAGALSYIRGNGDRRATNLRRQTEPLVDRPFSRYPIDLPRQDHRLLPGDQIAIAIGSLHSDRSYRSLRTAPLFVSPLDVWPSRRLAVSVYTHHATEADSRMTTFL